MSTIVLTSVSGAPGVTTTAIGLGRVWPQSSLVVEDDTHHAMLAGYLRASQHAEPNLAAVANLTSNRFAESPTQGAVEVRSCRGESLDRNAQMLGNHMVEFLAVLT